MSVHILGVGSIGGMWGALLHLANPITLLFKDKNTLARFQQSGLQLECEQSVLQIPASRLTAESITDGTSFISTLLVTTKAYDVKDALQSVAHRLTADSKIILMQNGMGVYEEVCKLLPHHTVIIAITDIGVFQPERFNIKYSGGNHLWLGNPQTNEPDAEILKRFADVPFDVQWDPEINARQWEKLSVNCAINPLTVLFNCTNGDLLLNQQATTLMSRLSDEVHHLRKSMDSEPVANSMFDKAVTVAQHTASNVSSTLQDVRRGKPTEMAYLNGFVARQARAHNIELPYNQAIWNIFKHKHYESDNAREVDQLCQSLL